MNNHLTKNLTYVYLQGILIGGFLGFKEYLEVLVLHEIKQTHEVYKVEVLCMYVCMCVCVVVVVVVISVGVHVCVHEVYIIYVCVHKHVHVLSECVFIFILKFNHIILTQ